MATKVIEDDPIADHVAPDDRAVDDDLLLQRYNSQLPSSYRSALDTERKLLIRALRFLVRDIISPSNLPLQNGDHHGDEMSSGKKRDEFVSEGYQHEIERDFAALEKGITRYMDLKHAFEDDDYTIFFDTVLRGALTPNLDMGLRSKLARCASRLLSKRNCKLPKGVSWRRIMDQIYKVHIDCVDGTSFIGKDVRESHCRNMLSLLSKCRLFLAPGDSAEKIWEHFSPGLHSSDPDVQFENALFLAHIMPTMGDAWTGWVPNGMRLWQLYESSNDWDAVWMTMASRVARHQPCKHDWTPYLSWIFTRIEDACCLPIGAMTPQGSIDRRCPSHICFLMEFSVIPVAARLCAYSLSPKFPAALHILKRFFALIANYFHPSNNGRWSSCIGGFMSNLTASLVARIVDERQATEAGVMGRVIGDTEKKGVAPAEHRLNAEYITELMDILLPLIDLGLHSKAHSLSVQSASSARDLSIVRPLDVIPSFLQKASEGLESVSSPHRTTAALRLLSTLTPVSLDPELFPDGPRYLPQALELTLLGVDPNDLGKTEATLRFIGGASARIQGMADKDPKPISNEFFEEYTPQFLERIFSLLDSLEAPQKKNPSGGYGGGQPLSFIIFAVAIENLFVTLPPSVAISSARKVAKQLTGAACSNAMKYYGALVRIACAVAANAMNGSSAEIFFPPLLDQLLETSNVKGEKKNVLVSVGDDELVWRIRMLAQACRYSGSRGIEPYIDKIMLVVQLAFEQPERAIYKSGGRLLRALLEGLTAIQMKFDIGSGDDKDRSSSANGDVYNLNWRVPTKEDWKLAEGVLVKFVSNIEEVCPISQSSTSDEIIAQRDVIFRVLRMLHAAQRGGRWLLAGAMPNHFLVLDKYIDEKVPLTKADAKLILKRPVRAGLGGERGDDAIEFATSVWERIYSLVFNITSAVMVKRPDDGALLYRCLEPLELAHEPFRRGSMSRNAIEAARSYKSAYKPVIAAKRSFESEGGVGRAMPRFIVKLRIEAHHEMRLTVAARGGMRSMKLCDEMVAKLTELALNDFPRVRVEARGVLTRALRVIKPQVRRREISRIIEVLRNSASKTKTEESLENGSDKATDVVMKSDESPKPSPSKKKRDDVVYEKMIGSCSVLRSSAAAPLIMRDTRLFSELIQAFLEAMPKAERPDAAGTVASLFGKLSALIRPLGIDPICIVNEDLITVPDPAPSPSVEEGRKVRLKAYNELNNYLLDMVKADDKKHAANEMEDVVVEMKNGKDSMSPTKKAEAHWRVQSLVAVLLIVLIREDMPPTPKVAEFFMRGVISDVVALRHICSRGVALILALHGRKAGVTVEKGKENKSTIERVPVCTSPTEWEKAGAVAIATMGRIVCEKEFMEKVVHTLALDHDDNDGIHRGGDLFTMLSYARVADGEACWTAMGGRPWPTSWTPRSRDSLNIMRIRFYESLIRVYGATAVDALLPCVKDLVSKLEAKQERIISGVKDEDVRVLAAELIAALCRGLDVHVCDHEMYRDKLLEVSKALLNDMTGPMGNTNGAALIRLISTADPFTVGAHMSKPILDWQLEAKPLIVEMGKGPLAHLQARRLRYIHSCVADLNENDDERMVAVVKSSMKDLIGEVGLNHELKTVREEVGRLLGLLSVNISAESEDMFRQTLQGMSTRLVALEEAVDKAKAGAANGSVQDDAASPKEDGKEEAKDDDDKARKSRSRQGETLSRFVSIVYWNGRARSFEPFVVDIIPTLFRSFDESDQERISHAKMALSLMAQGCFAEGTLDAMISAAESTVKDRRWKVRASVLGYLQILSFCSLFLASEATLARIRQIVFGLLSDAQIEVRQNAAAAFVTMIRDADHESVEALRDTCLKALRETTWRQRRKGRRSAAAVVKKPTLEGDKLFRRHGAVLGLSSMVTSSPYSVPDWMPAVLVALAECVNDPPPICTGVRELFADFMRTHRDEWQTHKLAFSTDELEIVSELLVSPSYYA